MTEIGIEQARQTLGDLVNQALYAGQVTYITRRGKRVAAVVPLERIMQTATGDRYVVVIEAANADRTIWEAVEAAEIVYGYWQHKNADDLAAWVAANQNVATGPGAARVRVWEGADIDAVHARPADAEREIPPTD